MSLEKIEKKKKKEKYVQCQQCCGPLIDEIMISSGKRDVT